jgi:hypothetical protein
MTVTHLIDTVTEKARSCAVTVMPVLAGAINFPYLYKVTEYVFCHIRMCIFKRHYFWFSSMMNVTKPQDEPSAPRQHTTPSACQHSL